MSASTEKGLSVCGHFPTFSSLADLTGPVGGHGEADAAAHQVVPFENGTTPTMKPRLRRCEYD